MTDQDVDFACQVQEGDRLLPMRLRYGATPAEAGRTNP